MPSLTFSIPAVLTTVLGLVATCAAAENSAAAVFAAWAKNPATQQHIPDVSCAGYHHGDDPLPTPAVVVSVEATGAVPNDGQDDSAAFQRALTEAAQKGGGAVEIPAGTWELDSVLRLAADGVVLRGAGTDRTTLLFRKPLLELQAVPLLRGQTQWSWSGGLVWMGPSNTWRADGSLNPGKGLECEAWERWRLGAELGTVSGTASAGSTAITLSATAAISAGDWVMLTWQNPVDLSLVKAMAGHPLVADGDLGGIAQVHSWPWPVQIAAIDGKNLTLAQPLRLDIRREWKVTVHTIDGLLREAGIEHLTIATSGFQANRKHNTYLGWNGIYLNRCADCFVRDVIIQDVDNGIIHAAAKNTTVTGFTIRGGAHHHATALRVQSHDNLLENFTIASQPMHGINTEGMSSGNVWRKGVLEHGTFDSHRGMSFDLVRTDITVAGDGRPGGASGAGPFLGRRCVHWNIRITGGDGSYINQSEQHSFGALVGVQGPSKSGVSFAMPAGDKGTIIVDANAVPSVADLYLAQLVERHAHAAPLVATTNTLRLTKPPAAKAITLNATATTQWNTLLAERVQQRLASTTPLRSRLSLLGGQGEDAEIQAIDGRTGKASITIRSTHGSMSMPLARMPANDHANLAIAVAGVDDAAGAACAAVHLAIAGNPRLTEWLEKSGSSREQVETAWGLNKSTD